MEYLSLMHAIMRSTDYLQHQHRLSDLQAALQRILGEEDDPGEDESLAQARQMDKLIVQQIYKEFPQIGTDWRLRPKCTTMFSRLSHAKFCELLQFILEASLTQMSISWDVFTVHKLSYVVIHNS